MRRYAGIVLLSAILLLQACTTLEKVDNLQLELASSAGDGIVLLANSSDSSETLSIVTDDDMDTCIAPALRKTNRLLRIIPAATFRARLYPYFSLSTMPQSLPELQTMVNEPVVHGRLDAMNVRFLVLVERAGTSNDVTNGIFCGGAEGGAGCLGLMLWDRHSQFVASIWDIRTQRHAGNLSVLAKGLGIMPALLIPIPVHVPATHNRACKEFGEMLGASLGGKH